MSIICKSLIAVASALTLAGAVQAQTSGATTSQSEMNRGVPGVDVDAGRNARGAVDVNRASGERARGVPGVDVDTGRNARGAVDVDVGRSTRDGADADRTVGRGTRDGAGADRTVGRGTRDGVDADRTRMPRADRN